MPDNRNFILAIVLSIVVLIGWQYFIAAPQIGPRRSHEQELTAANGAERLPAAATATDRSARRAAARGDGGRWRPLGGAHPRGGACPVAAGRDRDRRASRGSINLQGGRLDDLRLNDFHETVDPKSPTIVLLSPATRRPTAISPSSAGFGAPAGRRCPDRTRCGRRRPVPS